MPTPAHWLERLTHATEYRELQTLFSEIATEARNTEDPEAVASWIDEAILRIERERHRDEDELRAFEKEYDAFKEKQSGVVGWLKRHVPFTETRRQAKEHQAALADQEAEILADNLVIARAQMLKEGLLPPRDRRLGHEPAQWRKWLAERDAVAGLLEYASTLKELGRELSGSREFVKQVGADVDAFSRSRFASDEDRRRQKNGVAAARSELAACQAEIEDEEALRTRGVTRLRELVTSELGERDRSFDRLTERVSHLRSAAERAEHLEGNLETLRTELSTARDLAERIESLPTRRRELSREAAKLGHEAEDTERSRLHASTNLAEHAARAQDAEDRTTRAQADAGAAKRAWEAKVAETGQVEVPPGATFESSSPEAAAHARAEKALEEARAAQRAVRAAHEKAESETERAAKAAASAREELTKRRDESDGLAREERRLRTDLDQALRALRPMLDRLPRDAGDYRVALDPLRRTYVLGNLDGTVLPRRRFTVEGMGQRSHRELHEASERCAQVLDSIQQERAALHEDLDGDRKEREAALATRCRELLGNELGAEVCAQPR